MPSEENYEKVEGSWGDFLFRRVYPEDWDVVIQHVKDHFMRDEPTCKLLGYSEEFGSEMEVLLKTMLVDNLSFLVVYEPTGEIASVRITFRHTKSTNFNDIPVASKQGTLLLRLVDEMDKMADLFNRFGLEEYAEFFVASTDPKFRQRGLVTEMYRRNLQFLQAEGFRLCKSIFTSPYTRKSVTNLGFHHICQLDYDKFTDENGELAFNPGELTSDHFAAVMVYTLG